MKRASYKEAIEYIALNDAPGESNALDLEALSGYVTVSLVAAIFDLDPSKVATDVIRYRIKHDSACPNCGSVNTKRIPLYDDTGHIEPYHAWTIAGQAAVVFSKESLVIAMAGTMN